MFFISNFEDCLSSLEIRKLFKSLLHTFKTLKTFDSLLYLYHIDRIVRLRIHPSPKMLHISTKLYRLSLKDDTQITIQISYETVPQDDSGSDMSMESEGEGQPSKSQRPHQPEPRPAEPKPPIPVATVNPAPMNIPVRPPPPSHYIIPVSWTDLIATFKCIGPISYLIFCFNRFFSNYLSLFGIIKSQLTP